jgi:lambda family phage portal protein
MPIVDQYGKPIQQATKQAEALRKMRADSRAELSAAYDAAQTTGENQKHWRYADDLSASAANSLTIRKTLRQRARYECLEANSFGNGIVNTLANDTVSTGPRLQVQLPDRDAAKEIERQFYRWMKSINLTRKLRTARLAKCVDGEAFLLRVNNPIIRNQVQLDVQLVEADQISTPGWIEGRPGAVDGIIFDRYNNPTIYHVLKQHPGDTWVINSFEKEDVFEQDMIHVFNRVRPGQVRGIPEVTPALPLFAMLRRYTLATILAAETAADFAAVIETTANTYDSTGQTVDTSVAPFDHVQIDRGMMTSLPYGWKMSQFRPEQPTTTYESFRNAILMEIARCLGMPTNKARGDSSQYNYSSARLDHQLYYHQIEIERNEWETACLDKIFSWWLDEALLIDGYLPAIDAIEEIPHQWTWPPAKSANPVDDANAAISLINNGLMTEEKYFAENNIDGEAHYRELMEQFNRRKALGMLSQEQVMVLQMQEAAKAKAADQAAQAKQEAEQVQAEQNSASGEFMGLSRLQWNRNRKAIMDILTEYASKKMTRTMATVMLSGLGLSPDNVAALLDDASDGSVDSIPKEDAASG